MYKLDLVFEAPTLLRKLIHFGGFRDSQIGRCINTGRPKLPLKSCNVKSVSEVFELENGQKMPMLGLGTFGSPPGVVGNIVKIAVEKGYRHIDCAHFHQNEKDIGRTFKEIFERGALNREDLFITGKLWNTFHSPELVEKALRISLQDLRLKYLDLYLMHSPMGFRENGALWPVDACGRVLISRVDYVDTWKAMEELVCQGLVRSIGLSNFNKKQIQRVLKIATIKPAVNQIESHPYLNQMKLIKFCKSQKIAVTAYSPLGSPTNPWNEGRQKRLLDDPKILAIAAQHYREPAQILIRFHTQRGVATIPKGQTEEQIESNLNSTGFNLSEQEMRILLGMNENFRYWGLNMASHHPYYPFHDPY